VALGLYGVLQAVDGVALKQAVDAWANAPEAEKAARFASAETIRWLEWGTRSYQTFMFGLTLILLGSAVALTARLPRPLGYLMVLSGLAYIVQGWVLGSEGFSATNTFAILAGYVPILAWIIWLLVVAWRMKESIAAPAG
jgi:heme A synthase